MDEKDSSWAPSLLTEFGKEHHLESKGERKGSFQFSYIPQPALTTPLPQLYGDTTDM